MWHKADWDKVKKDPESIQFPRDEWIHTHDAEEHAEEVFDENFQQVRATEGTNGTSLEKASVLLDLGQTQEPQAVA
jgi:hypothetical protein